MSPNNPVKVFIAYHSDDLELCESLINALAALKREGQIDIWYNKKILPGDDKNKEVNNQLDLAQLILLLISANLIQSDEHYNVMERAMERHDVAQVRVIPIILRPTDLEGLPVSGIQCLPRNSQPVTTWQDQDDAFSNIASEIREIVEREITQIDLNNNRLYNDFSQPLRLPVTGKYLGGREGELRKLNYAWDDPKVKIIIIKAVAGAGKTILVYEWFCERGIKNDKNFGWSFYSSNENENDGEVTASYFIRSALEYFGDKDPSSGSPDDRAKRLARLITQFQNGHDHRVGHKKQIDRPSALKEQRILETRVEEQLRPDKLVDDIKTQRDQIEEQLKERENRLAKVNSDAQEVVGRNDDQGLQNKVLLVLDGLETLQEKGKKDVGYLRSRALSGLLKELAMINKNWGLCIITTRLRVADLDFFEDEEKRVKYIDLEGLPETSGIILLRKLGVKGIEEKLAGAVKRVKGHALTLWLLENYLRAACNGDIDRFYEVNLKNAANQFRDGHAWQVMSAYEKWLLSSDRKSELEVLCLISLFNGLVDNKALADLRKKTIIKGLTDTIANNSDAWDFAVENLRSLGLLAVSQSGELEAQLEAHMLVREYFRDYLKKKHSDAWIEGHARLFDYYKRNYASKPPSNLNEMKPLSAAVEHGCQAERWQEAFEEVYWKSIVNKKETFHDRPVPASGAFLECLSNFFESRGWSSPSSLLNDDQKALVWEEAGHYLFMLGRLQEAIDPLECGMKVRKDQRKWAKASRDARLIREIYLTQGSLNDAYNYADESVKLAVKSHHSLTKIYAISGLAQVEHYRGRWKNAENHFQEAEEIQKQLGQNYLYLYYGFWYCEFLLDRGIILLEGGSDPVGNREADRFGNDLAFELFRNVQIRADEAIRIDDNKLHEKPNEKPNWNLNAALDGLAWNQSLLLADRCKSPLNLGRSTTDVNHLIIKLRELGQQHYLTRGLLVHSMLSRWQERLDQAEKILADAQYLTFRSFYVIKLFNVFKNQKLKKLFF
jgi:hypothetical protein